MVPRPLEKCAAKRLNLTGKKILLVRFSAIGDCVMAAWAATALRIREPDSTIAWAVECRCAPVIDDQRLVQMRTEIPRHSWKESKWSPRTWRDQILFYRKLSQYNFDLGLDLQGHSKTALCLRLAAPKKRFAFRATDAFARILNPVLPSRPKSGHEIDFYAAGLREIGEYPLPERPIMPDVLYEKNFVRTLTKTSRPLATIQTGAGADDKRYPPEQWRIVGEALAKEGFEVAAIGAAGDPTIDSTFVEDWIGRLDLRQAIAAVGQSAIHFCGDTGSGHIAAALGIPVVSVFGPTPPERFRPWSTQAKVLRRGLLTENVTPEEILAAAMALVPNHAAVLD